MLSGKKIYWALGILSAAGYAWIGFCLTLPVCEQALTICLFKNVTGLPCPSCGITRSVCALMTGDFQKAILINPLGLIATLGLLVAPAWILRDALTRRNTLAMVWLCVEGKLKTQKILYLPAIALILVNWGWNVFKHL